MSLRQLQNFSKQLKLEKLLENRSNYVTSSTLTNRFIVSLLLPVFSWKKKEEGGKKEEERKISGKQETLRKKYGRGYLRKKVPYLRGCTSLFVFPLLLSPSFPLFARWIAFRKSAAIIDVPGCPVRRSWCEVTMNNLVACVYMQMSRVKEFLRVLKAKTWWRAWKVTFVSSGSSAAMFNVSSFGRWSRFLHANTPRVCWNNLLKF